jgi:hypothetical protein
MKTVMTLGHKSFVTQFSTKEVLYYIWWLFEELLKVFTWLVGFPYQISIISALIRKYIANFSYRCTVISYFVPTKTRPTYICTRCSRAIWAFGGWVVYCTTHGRFSACFHLKFAIYFLIKAEIIDIWYGNPTSHVNTFSNSSKCHHSIAPQLSKIVWRNFCDPESCQFSSVCLRTCKLYSSDNFYMIRHTITGECCTTVS